MRLYSRRRRRKALKKKRHFADYIVFLSILAVTGFTVAAFVLQFKGLMEISATLTGCWFGFVTAILVAFGVDDLTIEQIIALITAASTLIAYIIGEGMVDAARLKSETKEGGGENE